MHLKLNQNFNSILKENFNFNKKLFLTKHIYPLSDINLPCTSTPRNPNSPLPSSPLQNLHIHPTFVAVTVLASPMYQGEDSKTFRNQCFWIPREPPVACALQLQVPRQ
jgi:hypothetical protein